MKILVAGDVHGNAHFMQYLVKNASKNSCDRILQVGDFGIWPGPSGVNFLDDTQRMLDDNGLTLDFIGGNHEDYDELNARVEANDLDIRSNIHYIPNGTRWEYDGVRFGGIGGAFSVDYMWRTPGQSWWPHAEEAHEEDADRLGEFPLDVFICHDTPYPATELAHFRVEKTIDARCEPTRDVLRRAILTTNPKIVLHGHWHKRSSYTWHNIRIEALACDLDHNGNAWGILDTSDLSFRDGYNVRN